MERKAREKNAARLDADEKSKRKGMVDKTIDEINELSYSRVQLELLYLAHRVARGDGCAYRDVAYSFGSLAGSLATIFLQFIAFSVIGDEQALLFCRTNLDCDLLEEFLNARGAALSR